MKQDENIEIDSIGLALAYIKGYCEKHASCAGRDATSSPCRLYDSDTNQCFLYSNPVPADWEVL